MGRIVEIRQRGGVTRVKTEPVVIGGPGAHIVLPGQEEQVAAIGQEQHFLFLHPLAGGQEIFHNNERVSEPVWIKSGDTTRIGEAFISYHVSGDVAQIIVSDSPPPAPPAATAPMPGRRPLPRMEEPREKTPLSPAMKLILTGLFLLALAGVFLLLARPVTVRVTPEPRTLAISGFPPPLSLGGRFLMLPGDYTVTARLEGYHPLNEHFSVDDGGRIFSFAMRPLPGILDVDTDPQGATVRVDGKDAGKGPVRGFRLPAGVHRVEVSHPKYKTVTMETEIPGRGRRRHLDLRLEPNWGTVELRSIPTGASINVDDTPTESLTPAVLELEAGRRRVALSLPLYQTKEVVLTVAAGERLAPPPFSLAPLPARIDITSAPKAKVAIDAVFKGETPLSVEVASKTRHMISLEAAGHQPASAAITPQPGERRTVHLALAPLYATLFVNFAPPHATILIDGEPSASPSGRFQVLAMPHTIEARAEGFIPATRTIRPAPGATEIVEIRLRPKAQAMARARDASAKARGLVLVAPGRMLMGSSRREQGRRSNEFQHQIELTRPFYIGTREVTNAQFKRFKQQHSSGSFAGYSLDGDSLPVVNVSWEEAAAYCNWLSRADGLPPFYALTDGTVTTVTPPTIGYRLPTEAEWAYAARRAKRDETVKYGWGGRFPPPDNSGNFADETARALLPVVLSGYRDGFMASAPVASFAPNPAGVYDMEGNVAEWCHDWYAPTAPVSGREKNPLGPAEGTHHVVRGASWRDAAITELRLAARRYAGKGADDIGFRVARYAR